MRVGLVLGIERVREEGGHGDYGREEVVVWEIQWDYRL